MGAEQRRRERKRRKREDAKRNRNVSRSLIRGVKLLDDAESIISMAMPGNLVNAEPVVDVMSDQMHRRTGGGVVQYFKKWFRLL